MASAWSPKWVRVFEAIAIVCAVVLIAIAGVTLAFSWEEADSGLITGVVFVSGEALIIGIWAVVLRLVKPRQRYHLPQLFLVCSIPLAIVWSALSIAAALVLGISMDVWATGLIAVLLLPWPLSMLWLIIAAIASPRKARGDHQLLDYGIQTSQGEPEADN